MTLFVVFVFKSTIDFLPVCTTFTLEFLEFVPHLDLHLGSRSPVAVWQDRWKKNKKITQSFCLNSTWILDAVQRNISWFMVWSQQVTSRYLPPATRSWNQDRELLSTDSAAAICFDLRSKKTSEIGDLRLLTPSTFYCILCHGNCCPCTLHLNMKALYCWLSCIITQLPPLRGN